MINYSTCMRGNPTDKDAAKKAYANAQYSQVMTLDKFCYHIASHGCVYSRADIQAILILAVDCLREQLLNGQQIQMGDLGVFSNSIRSLGAHSMAEFTVENITEVNVLWAPGVRFNNLRQDAEFQLVPTRKAAAEVVKALKAGKTTVDLTGNSLPPALPLTTLTPPAFQPPPANRQTKIADRLVPLHRDSMM